MSSSSRRHPGRSPNDENQRTLQGSESRQAQPGEIKSEETSSKLPSDAKQGHSLVSNFSQQKLRAWQPVLTPKWIISVFLGFGIIFIALGSLLLVTSNGVVECSLGYDDPDLACSESSCTNTIVSTIDVANCVGPNPASIKPPVYVYYQLTNYFQNHRRYVKSRNDDQLRGHVFTNPSDLATCDPIISGPDSRVYHPCGLSAWSVFNDSYTFQKKNGEQIPYNDDPLVIAWSTDVKNKFKNPDPDQVDETKVNLWLNKDLFPNQIEDGHFIVWMRNAALPYFRKLWAKIEVPVSLPITVTISSRYPVKPFGGTKTVVLSTTSWLGGRNSFLGIAYLVIGAWCLIFGIFFVFQKYKNPRILGDVRYLNWVANRRPD